MGALLTYALNKDNRLVHVDEVKIGAACECHCPHCDSPLNAKNGGKIREHHFAHAHGHTCEGAYETALHLLAKQVVEEERGIMLPDSEIRNMPTGFVKLSDIEIEKWDNTFNIRPDAEGILNDGRRLLIEFLVSHKITNKKYDTIIANNLLCIEIDLNWLELEKNVLRKFLTQENKYRKWIVKKEARESSENFGSGYQRNPRFDKARNILKEAFDNKKLSIQTREGKTCNLQELGYNVCEVDANFRRFKTDLLLFRSNEEKEEKKGYISINFRGRQRKEGSKLPPGLRIIDILIHEETDNQIQARFSSGTLKAIDLDCVFLGEWKWLK